MKHGYRVVKGKLEVRGENRNRYWDIEMPDGYLLGTSFADRDEALHLAAELNAARQEGIDWANARPPRRPR